MEIGWEGAFQALTDHELVISVVLVDKTGGINILGRSDGVLNPQGVRFGSAELYTIVEEMKDEYVLL